jgi:hypothetical protein
VVKKVMDRMTASRTGHMYRFVDGPISEHVFLEDNQDEPEHRRVPSPDKREKMSQRSTQGRE